MRQGDGSDLLGPGDPRNSDIGILYVESKDSRQDILTAISTQELQGRKQIAIVLPEQGKAFRQPVDFDGLKNMRRQLKAQLIFIAPSGPGPAEFARQRRFPVYSSLDTFKSALLNEGIPSANPRVKTNPGGAKRPGLLAFGSRKTRTSQEAPQAVPPTPRLQSQQPISPIPPTPRVQDQSASRSSGQVPASSIEDMKTVEMDQPGKAGPAAAAGAAAGMLAASALGGDDDDTLYAPPAPPATPGPVAPIAQGSATPTGPAVGPARPAELPPKPPQDSRAAPDIIVFPTATPAATPKTTGKMSAVQGTQGPGSGKMAAAQGSKGPGSGKLPASPASPGTPAAQSPQNMPGPQNQPADRNGGSGKMAAVGAGAALGAAAMAGAPGSPGGALTATGASAPSAVAGGPTIGQRPAGLTPLPPPYSRRSRRRFWRRTIFLLLLLLLLSGALAFGIFAAQGRLPGLPGSLTANVTITPASKLESDNYLLEALPTGTPDPAQRQIGARLLTQTSGTSTATGSATGSIPATRATGMLTFINTNNFAVTLSPTPIPGSDGVEVSIYQNVTVPAAPSFTATVPAFAVNPGSAGNIKAFDVSRPCCTGGITVKNTAPFTGGQDAQPNSVIQQSDIDKAAQPLVSSLSQSTGNVLQKQVKSNERVVDNSFKCKPTVNPSVKAGTVAKTVTVQVQVTCTEEVYDFAAAQSMATGLLQTKAQNDPALNPQYALDGRIVTSVLSDTVVTAQGQVSIEIQAQGLWVYQFTNQMQQNIKNSLVKLSKASALNVLLHDMGVAAAKISISSGDLMPANASDITLTIQTLPGVQGSPTGTPVNSPTVLPTGPTPTPTPVNGLGGS